MRWTRRNLLRGASKMAGVDLDDGDSLRILGALARALNGSGVEPTLDALDALADGGGDADVSANARPDGRRILSPSPADGDAWSTPSLLDD